MTGSGWHRTKVGGMPQWKQLATPARTDLAIATGLLI